MTLRNLFRVTAALNLIIGMIWLVAPKAMPASYGINLDAYAAYYLQQLGVLNISLAILLFLVSGMAQSPARQAVVTFYFVMQVLSGIVNLVAALSGALPANVAGTAFAFNLVLALAFGYFRFIRPEANMAPGLET